MKQFTHMLLIAGLIIRSSGTQAQSDFCPTAVLLTCGTTVTGNTTAFTADIAPTCLGVTSNANGVWYRILGTGANITASLCGSGYDTRIRVYSGTCGGLVCVASNDDFCGLQSQVTWASVAATNYIILVHGSFGGSGPYTLAITCAPLPGTMCYTNALQAYAPAPFAGTPVALSDDFHSPAVPIGFSFCFAGVTYTQCVIASNGYITFNLANASTFSPWGTTAVPVTTAQVINSVMAPWQDIHPGLGVGSIMYQTLGVAPNRRFVVSYLSVPMFSCTSLFHTSQIILHEGSNCISTMIQNKPICSGWNGGLAVHALQNTGGTAAQPVTGRNNTVWTVASEGMRFTPVCGPCSNALSMGCLTTPMPIELVDFHGSNAGSENILEWATASEQNSDHFTVERSADGGHFEAIHQVNGAGNSSWLIDYMVTDEAPLQGVNYYRLRTTDVDGSERLSDVITVYTAHGTAIAVHPNPATNGSQYVLPQGTMLPVTLLVRDLAGRAVKTMSVDAPVGPLDLSGLRSGSYLLELGSTAPVSTVRFMIE